MNLFTELHLPKPEYKGGRLMVGSLGALDIQHLKDGKTQITVKETGKRITAKSKFEAVMLGSQLCKREKDPLPSFADELVRFPMLETGEQKAGVENAYANFKAKIGRIMADEALEIGIAKSIPDVFSECEAPLDNVGEK